MPVTDPLLALRHLTDRDRTLLSWLAEHYVLATEHIAQALFPSLRSAQVRLRVLHHIAAVGRFAFASSEAETRSWRYTLGPLGLHLHPQAWHDPDNPAAKAPQVRARPVWVLRMCLRMAKPITMMGMKTPTP